MAPNNSQGKSGTANFLDGGVKGSLNVDMGRGHAFSIGAGDVYKRQTCTEYLPLWASSLLVRLALPAELVFQSP